MKILSCCPQGYYIKASGSSYEYVSFVEELRTIGHTVHHYDHVFAAQAGKEAMNDFFLSIVKHGNYDLTLIVTFAGEFLLEVLDEAKRHTVTLAWNCDDDWRWEDYSANLAPHFTFMATTYRHIYEANRAAHPNLLLSQWGCTESHEGFSFPKPTAISFAGLCYGTRQAQVERLRRSLGMEAYGRGVPPAPTLSRSAKKILARWLRIPMRVDSLELPDQEAVKGVWNRSRVSFTPLDASRGGLQIKARVFDMGLSGTVMLCSRNPGLYEFYEPGREFADFETMDECEDKAKFLLSHEAERLEIARRYYERTRKEHLWRHRYQALFSDMGMR